ncbi:NAD(P)H-dependent oxidoreductase [Frankia sp. AiPs1]|uniref:FMN-dependent NADH-azoreductase n=1 Tax=Frankia sp. AiPs1 TaxID=573493 RepID=UPI00204441C9|nr:NAD(P)H-dependent oxidoreductase [Frankia sp. AiPs1]MCM3924617.1 NAD(P)H-dependent oxidoreductase [Frankia sp. AiPs1]
MPGLLHLDSSADLTGSTTRALTRTFADTWQGLGPQHTVTYRDLHVDPPPHLSDAALHWAPRLRRPGETPDPAAAATQELLLAELLAADVLVVGAPMYNWSIPSTLKAWIDQVHVLGVTAPFDTREQPLAGRPAVVVSARGAQYGPGSPTAGWDHAVPPVELVLGRSLGMAVTVVSTDATLAFRVPAMAELRTTAKAELDAAHRSVIELATRLGHQSATAR